MLVHFQIISDVPPLSTQRYAQTSQSPFHPTIVSPKRRVAAYLGDEGSIHESIQLNEVPDQYNRKTAASEYRRNAAGPESHWADLPIQDSDWNTAAYQMRATQRETLNPIV